MNIDLSKCPRCNGTNFSLRDAVLDGKVVYRIFECYDCRDAELKRSIDEAMVNRPELATSYSRAKLRTDYYSTVTIKDNNEA